MNNTGEESDLKKKKKRPTYVSVNAQLLSTNDYSGLRGMIWHTAFWNTH